jgi:hypothetical protein
MAESAVSARDDELLAAAARAVRLRPPVGFTWRGRSSPALPANAGRVLTERNARECLAEAVANRLYTDWYLTGGVRTEASRGDLPFRDDAFVRSLSDANEGIGPWDGGWVIAGSNGGGDGTVPRIDGARAVTKAGLTLIVPRNACRPSRRRDATGGSLASVHLPKDLPAMSPGYYMALGDRPWTGEGAIRVYWNMTAAAAATFVGVLTRGLNEKALPFRLKVLDHPDSYRRCDAGVLYLPGGSYQRAAPLLREVQRELAPSAMEAVPALTRPIAPGVGVAEDPPDGQSFGMHRCRLVAEGLRRAHDQEASSVEEKTDHVRAVFAEAGVDSVHPYRALGSRFAPEPL